MEICVEDVLKENTRRHKERDVVFNPMTGEGSLGERVKLVIPDFVIPTQYVPKAMMNEKIVKDIKKAGTIQKYIDKNLYGHEKAEEYITKVLMKIRSKYDFPFWAIMFCKIKNKSGGKDIPFRLNSGQRKIVDALEKQRLANKPMRLVLLKARQFGGSTVIQIYICWIQLVHITSTNSVIATHANSVSATVRGMVTKLLSYYPKWMLHPVGAEYNENEEAMTSFGGQDSIKYIPSRQCKIRIATASNPEALRSEDVALAHLSEVALWQDTKLIHPEDYVDAILSGIMPKPYTLKVLESTAKGVGGYYHKEYVDAKNGIGEYTPIFVGWKDIENDTIEFDDENDKREFAQWLIDNRHTKEAPDRRSESGSYLWAQWEDGATLEGLHWYVEERKSKSSHDHMASEAPSNDVEAFTASGEMLFDPDNIEQMRKGCKPPRWIGEVQGKGSKGVDVIKDVKFKEDKTGELWIWNKPELFDDEKVKNRYVVTVDIGGTSAGADWSVICVIDRYWMMEGGKPTVVAQWRGHIDHDLLAWKAAQIAQYYDEALLVIESNTLDKDRDMNADLSDFILNRVKAVYDNLYERSRSEEDIKNGLPTKYGWHTNRNTKPAIVKNLQECVRDMLYVERDERALNEMLNYQHNDNRYEAKSGEHDDMLMVRAIGLWVSQCELDMPVIVSTVKRNVNEKISSQSLI